MTKILVIPDVHEELARLRYLEPLIAKADHTVFLGDWFDSFDKKLAHETAEWLKAHLYDQDKTFLLGNHDCHYAFTNRGFLCSGYQPWKDIVINNTLTREDWSRFQLCYWVADDLILSHAGLSPTLHSLYPTQESLATACQEALEMASRGDFHQLFRVGAYRGGNHPDGGLTWLDFNAEFEPIPGLRQIVGHTKGREVRRIDDNWCIDTGLAHIAWVKDGKITVELV